LLSGIQYSGVKTSTTTEKIAFLLTRASSLVTRDTRELKK